MLERLLDVAIGSEVFERLLLERVRPIVARAEAGQDYLVASLTRGIDAPVLLVTPGPREAEQLASGVEAWLGPEGVALLPAWEALPYEGLSPSPEVAARRSDAVRRLRAAKAPFVLVAPALAAMQGIVPTLGEVPPIELVKGVELPPDAIAERLVVLGYQRADVVEHRGEFAVRGGVLDVFPGNARRPVRLEYWGDEIESLREFVPSSQMSSGPVVRVQVPPVRELVVDDELAARARERAPRYLDRFRDGLERIGEGLHAEGAESFAPLLFDRLETPAELLPEGAWIVLTDAQRTLDRARAAFDDAEALATASGWPGPPAVRPLEDALGDHVQVRLQLVHRGYGPRLRGVGERSGQPGRARPASIRARRARLPDRPVGAGARLARTRSRGRADPGRGGPRDAARRGFRVPGRAARRRDRGGPVRLAASHAGGAEVHDPPDRRGRRGARSPVTSRCTGSTGSAGMPGSIDARSVVPSATTWCSSTAPGDRLSVPTDQVGMVARYVGGETPRLSRLGSGDWARTTSRVKRAVKDMAGELVRLYSVRLSVERPPYGPDTPWQMELEDAFPHEETGDQRTAIDEVKADLVRARPMDRLICGDVGFGKTEIAVRAAFKAVMEGKQVAVLVPTTLLAEQHLITFGERYAPFPVKLAMLSRFVSKQEQARDRRGPVPRGDRRRDRDAPAPVPGRRVQGSRPASSSTRSSASASRTRSA